MMRFLLFDGGETLWEGKGEREGTQSRILVEHGAQGGARSHNPVIVTSAKTKTQPLCQLSHPDAPNRNSS